MYGENIQEVRRHDMIPYQARRHPVVTFFAFLILGPYIAAAALIILVLYVLFAGLCVASGNTEHLRIRR
jgi:hypothetical protein